MVSVSAKIFLTCFFVNIVLTVKTERYKQDPQVSQFFETAGKVSSNDFESRRRERLLGQELEPLTLTPSASQAGAKLVFNRFRAVPK